MIIQNNKKKQKQESSDKKPITTFIVLFLIILSSFLLLEPKVSYQLFGFKRHMILQNFLKDTTVKNAIDPRLYWEFREFYSPGHFVFNKNGLSSTDVKQTLQAVSIPLKQPITLPFLTFQSPYVTSLDSLVTTNDLTKLINTSLLHDKKLLFQKKNEVIYQDGDTIRIAFLLPLTEMQKANGFFDYQRDQKLITGKYWLNLSTIMLR